MRLKDKEEITAGTSKNQSFGTVSAITTEAGERREQNTGSTEKTTCHYAGPVTESLPMELGDLTSKLEQIAQEWRARPRENEKRGLIH